MAKQTAPVAVIEQRVVAATTLDDLPALVKALTDRVQEIDTANLKGDALRDREIAASSGVVASLQSQILWVCAACLLFGAAAGYVLTKVVG